MLHDSVVLPWSCVSVPAPHHCLPGSQQAQPPIRSSAQEAKAHESSVREPAFLSVRLEEELLELLLPFLDYYGHAQPATQGCYEGREEPVETCSEDKDASV